MLAKSDRATIEGNDTKIMPCGPPYSVRVSLAMAPLDTTVDVCLFVKSCSHFSRFPAVLIPRNK